MARRQYERWLRLCLAPSCRPACVWVRHVWRPPSVWFKRRLVSSWWWLRSIDFKMLQYADALVRLLNFWRTLGSQRTQIGQKAPCSWFGGRAVLICIALKMGQLPKACLLFDKRAQNSNVLVSIVSYLDLWAQFIRFYYSPPNVTGVSNFQVIMGYEPHTVLQL